MEIVLVVAAFVLILLGCVFVFVPGLPGPLVAWCGPLIYVLFTKSSPEEMLPAMSAGTLMVSGLLAAFTLAFDFVSSWWGAKKYGATWRGGVGALIGALIGPIVFSPLGGVPGMLLGLLIGPLVGAVLGELIGGRDWKNSSRAGWGTLVGALLATVVKLFYCLGVFVWLLGSVLVRVL